MSASLTTPKLRPLDYTQEIGSIICDRLFDGEILSEICRDLAMPDRPTVMCWLAQNPKFLDEYLFTCQLRVENLTVAGNADTACRKWVRGAIPNRKEVL